MTMYLQISLLLQFFVLLVALKKVARANPHEWNHPPPHKGGGRHHGDDDDDDDELDCFKPPGWQTCFLYNKRFFASTAEEAVLNFVDPKTGKNWVSSSPQNAGGNCNSNECKGCLQLFIDRLERDLPRSSAYDKAHTDFNATKHRCGLHSADYRSYCPQLNNVPQPTPPPTAVNSTDLANIFAAVIAKSYCGTNQTNTHNTVQRAKRQGSNIGTTSSLNCNYRRGNPLPDGSYYVGLCNLCSAVRTLPSQYFPRYINEISCQSNDNRCLSGYGTCRENYRSVDVLINFRTDANPQWIQYSINSPVSCECQVQSGSAMTNFVSG